jgi:hypothetical protein
MNTFILIDLDEINALENYDLSPSNLDLSLLCQYSLQ